MSLFGLAQPGSAQVDLPTVALGQMQTSGGRLNGELRVELTRAIGDQGGVIVTPRRRARYVLDAALLKLDHQRGHDGLEVKCEVSLIVSDAQSGAMHAIVSGKGGVRTDVVTESTDLTALKAAIRSAVRPLGQTLRSIPE